MSVGLLDEIEAFLAETGMAVSRFGFEAKRDYSLVQNMRRGRVSGPAVEARVRAFMAAYRRSPPPQPAPKPARADGKRPRRRWTKPMIPVAVLRAREIDGRDLPRFIEALVMMGLDCWRDDRIAHGEPVPAATGR